jgi:sec-independent protein translocase protein TatA
MGFGSIGMPELLIILLVVLLLFGAKRLPELARGLGKGIREFKDATKNVEKEFKELEESEEEKKG